ncbi:MAG: YfhO family protein [Gemmatimonadetes bacterium]|nr:YfhO family protein [Gemmatimonadota bacterium]
MTRSPDVAAPVGPPPAAPPGPRFALGWAALIHAVCTLALGFPALAGKFLVNPYSDQYIAGYPFREFARSHWHRFGEIPQWNPYLFGGMPFVDAMHGDTFYPTAALRILIGTDAGMTWGLLLHVFLAGLFTFVFLRAIGLSFFAAVVGGVAYQMGGNVAGLVSPGHDGKMFIAALLPLALYFVVRGVRDGRKASWGALAIVVGLAVLSPHPQLLQYMLLVTGAFALFLALGYGSDSTLARRDGVVRLGAALSSVAVGMVIGAIQFWPVKTYEPFSPRAGGKGWEHAVSYSLPPEETLNFMIPQFTGILDKYWGRNGIHFHSEYIGAAVLFLAGLALGAWTLRSHKRIVWFFLGAFVISLLWAMGGYTPFYSLVYALVPGTKYFRAPSTMLFVVSFCAAVLAAFGSERIVRLENRRRYAIGWIIAAVLIGVLGASGALTNVGVSIAGAERADYVMANDGALRVGALRSMLFILMAVGIAFVVSTRRVSRDLGGTLLILLVALDCASVLRQYWQFSEPAEITYASNPVIDYLKKQPGPYRVLSFQTAPSEGVHDPLLNYDGLMVHGIANVLGYHGNELGAYDRLAGKDDGFRQVANPNFWRLLNMRYVLTNSPDNIGIKELKQVAGPARDASGSELYLHEIPFETSYAWVTPAMAKADEASVMATVLDPRFDVRRATVFDNSAAVKVEPLTNLPEPLAIRATVKDYSPGRATIELDSPAPPGAALMVSENWYPGWTATVDGKTATIGKAAVSLMGIALPAGARKVQLQFTNPPYETGKSVTLMALAAALLMLAGGTLLDRRRASSV